MGLIKKTNEAADRLCQILLVALFTLIIVSSFLQVFSRFVLGKAFVWTDELSRYGLVWLTFAAAACFCFSGNRPITTSIATWDFLRKPSPAATKVSQTSP